MQEIKKICAFTSRNFPTMQKHVIQSSSPLGISKQKPMKRTVIRKSKNKNKNKNKKHMTRKDLIFNNVVSYLVSDSYMYNPLVCSQPTFDLPPPKPISTSPGGEEEEMALPIGGRNKKFIQKVVDFLETDCYLYSPLLTKELVCSKTHPPTPTSGHFQTRRGSSTTETQGGETQHMAREGGDLGRHLRARPTVVTKTVAYHESVKHMVHRNRHSKPIQAP